MDWSNEVVMTFLDYYGEEPILWNASHPWNKKRDAVYDAWKRIEKKMGDEATVEQLKKKKDSLMASFRVVAKRAKRSTKNGTKAYVPIWFAYEKMASFLNERDDQKTTLNTEDPSFSVLAEVFGDYNEEDTSNDNVHEGSTNVIPQQATSVQKQGEVHSVTSRDSGRRNLVKRKAPNENSEGMKEQKEDAYPPMQNMKQKKNNDYCDQYGDVVASRLRQLDEWHRDSAINKIDNILYEQKCMYLGRFQNHSLGADHTREFITGGPSAT